MVVYFLDKIFNVERESSLSRGAYVGLPLF